MPPALDLPLFRFDANRPPAVLIGGVNLVRALGLAGLDVIVASFDPAEPAFASRYCKGRVVLPRLENSDAAANALVNLGDRLASAFGRRVPLMYGSDGALRLVQAHRERLQRYFLFLLPDADVGEALIAKDRFNAFARHRGLPVPRSLAWNGEGPGTVRGTPDAVLVKPSDKIDWHDSPLCRELFGGDGKARVFDSGPQAADDPRVAAFHRQLTFQVYVPGTDSDQWSFHGFADEHGEILASFIGRKLRTYPAVTGESAFIELAHDASLARVAREVARLCPLKGPFKMDFKRDPRNGRWHLLEINARYTLWQYLAASNGINMMAVAYECLLNGKAPAEVPAAETRGLRWLSLQLDFKAYRELASRGELDFLSWLASILASRNIYNLFAWDDAGPWRALWRARLARRWRRSGRMLATLRSWLSTAS